MKILLSLTLCSIILTTSHTVFSSQAAIQTVVKEKDIVKVYQDKKLYLAIKREEESNQINYIARNFFTKQTLTYIFSPIAKTGYSITLGEDGFQCISPTDENKMLLTFFEAATVAKSSSLLSSSSQSVSCQSSSTATSTQAPGTTATAQAQSSSTASSLIASVMSYFRKS